MVCIYCGSPTKVTNSRPRLGSLAVWRRRSCQSCKAVFTTNETIDQQGSLMVSKTTGDLEPFQRDKLLVSVYESLKHRKTAVFDATALTDTIIKHVLPRMRQGTILEADLVIVAKETLLRFDKAASVYYSAFHNL